MKKAGVPSYPLSAKAKTLIRLGGCPGWSESSLGAHSLCFFSFFFSFHVVAHLSRSLRKGTYSRPLSDPHTCTCSHSICPHPRLFVCSFLDSLLMCVRTAKALERLCRCAGLRKTSLFACVICIIFVMSWLIRCLSCWVVRGRNRNIYVNSP